MLKILQLDLLADDWNDFGSAH